MAARAKTEVRIRNLLECPGSVRAGRELPSLHTMSLVGCVPSQPAVNRLADLNQSFGHFADGPRGDIRRGSERKPHL